MNKFKYIIDLRRIEEIARNGRIRGSINNVYEKIKDRPIQSLRELHIKKKDMILFYCQSGARSREITWLTRELGYNSYDLELGYKMYVHRMLKEMKKKG